MGQADVEAEQTSGVFTDEPTQPALEGQGETLQPDSVERGEESASSTQPSLQATKIGEARMTTSTTPEEAISDATPQVSTSLTPKNMKPKPKRVPA